ncbi:hypothetical protein KY290_027334 [Solanum tuberosum]|uniref:MULE transposase domain-containing protein n=1 Tax=Solanum tuberosum TaxID=4113 RepID=A0ABQ7UGH0_SOLTU|nr:hypothetical protein KY290_027334 [Solanum tuberosum]
MDNPDSLVVVNRRVSDVDRTSTNFDLYSNNSIRLVGVNLDGVVDESTDNGVISDVSNLFIDENQVYKDKKHLWRLCNMLELSRNSHFLYLVLVHLGLESERKSNNTGARRSSRVICQNSRPIVVVDGAALRGSYGGTMLTASTMDLGRHILPLAYAIVDSENDASWTWFFEQFREAYGEREHMCFMSDRNESIWKGTARVIARRLPVISLLEFMRVIPSTVDMHAIADGPKKYIVNLNTKVYSCGRFQNDEIPCGHGMTVLRYRKLHETKFCSPFYSLKNFQDAYAIPFEPIPCETVLQLFSDGVLVGVLLVGCLEVGELVVWWSFAGCFSLGDGGLGSGGLKCDFTTGFWHGDGGV